MTAVAEQFTITDQDRHATIGRCYAILARARSQVHATGCALFAMAVLRRALKDYARAVAVPGSGDTAVAVLVAEAATENLIAIIRRDRGDDEAAYVTEGDD